MFKGFRHVVNDLDRDYIVKKLCCIIVIISRSNVFRTKYLPCKLTASYLNVVLVKSFFKLREKILCDIPVNKTAFNCVAYRRTRGLAVINNVHSHFYIRTCVNINVTVSCAGLDNRHSGRLYNSLYKLCASPWDKDINIIISFHHIKSDASVSILHKLNDIRTEACPFDSLSH